MFSHNLEVRRLPCHGYSSGQKQLYCRFCLSIKVYCLSQVTSPFWLPMRGVTIPPDSRQIRIKDSDSGCHPHEGSLPLFEIFIREGLTQYCFRIVNFSSGHVVCNWTVSVHLLEEKPQGSACCQNEWILFVLILHQRLERFYKFNSNYAG